MAESVKEKIRQITKTCQNSVEHFISNYGKVKHPSAGVIPFNVFSYQRRCLRAFDDKRFVIFSKVRQCFAGHCQIWTPDGPRRIDTLRTGDAIYSLNPQTGLLEVVKITKIYKNGKAKCVEVKTKTGHRSNPTGDHEFLTRRGWVAASKLSKDDIIVEVFEPPRYGMTANKSEAIILGYLLTDGYCGRRCVHFTNTRWKYLLEYQKHFTKLFGNDVSRLSKQNNSGFGTENAFRVWSYSNKCKEWLKDLGILGLTKKHKIIPKQIFSWDNESIAILINRMFAADGWYSGDRGNEIGIGQISVQTLYQLKQLLGRFGINAKVYENANPIPKLRILGGPDFEKFVKHIGIFGKEPRRKITKGFIFNRTKGQLKSVKPNMVHDVYDLEIPPHHNYIVDGAVVHNCGISTLAGIYALHKAMFFSQKTILVTSKRDNDAKEFVSKNIRFVWEHLPNWMKEIWYPTIDNEHEFGFANGSKILSLPSGPHTLRQYSSSLNILDEASVAPHMDEMWGAGAPTLIHGGSCIVIATSNGIGDWYWKTWTDAQDGYNDFYPIEIDWWDMDWTINYKDQSGNETTICPTAEIRKCTTDDEKTKYGPYWSPWLEHQYRQLSAKGGENKFRQEILRDFLGSGKSVLDREVLEHIKGTQSKQYKTVDEVDFVHPSGDSHHLEFANMLWVWREPQVGHIYVIGIDTSTGEAHDWSAIEIFDVIALEQAAELQIKCSPRDLALMSDFLGRWYNAALLVPERSGIGFTVCKDLEDANYPSLWRRNMMYPDEKDSDKQAKSNPVGFNTTGVGKPVINRALIDGTGEGGFKIYSHRLSKQLQTYVHLGQGKTGAEKGTLNDDLPIAAGLAMLGADQAATRTSDHRMLQPLLIQDGVPLVAIKSPLQPHNDPKAIAPLHKQAEPDPMMDAEQQIAQFAAQMVAKPDKSNIEAVKDRGTRSQILYGIQR